ncbi:hypothetical protein NPIL_288141 [Nephila pilipes]|uniref:Uncharacterized protein n=1 Tax=Nephila pilipes TaxID=299642 RepID=A0A8X6UK68_NEPPI|nr:hypothetical protein NPIL_288141 [Nephila pilipes]
MDVNTYVTYRRMSGKCAKHVSLSDPLRKENKKKCFGARSWWMYNTSYIALRQEIAFPDCSMRAAAVVQKTPLSTPVNLWANTLDE